MIRLRAHSLWLNALLLALAWQLFMSLMGIFLEQTFSDHNPVLMTPLSHMTYWDGGWFWSIIADNGYRLNPAAPAFYPFFPLVVAGVQALSFQVLSVTAAALLVNTLATWLAIVALVRLAEQFVEVKYRWLVVGLFLTSPAAIFLHFLYAEAVFCALAFWAYLFALRRQWVYMALALSLLATVKIPALLFIGLCGLEFMRAHSWSAKKMLNRYTLAFAIVPLGFVGYGLYLQWLRGDFLAMFHAYDYEWPQHVFNPNVALPIIDAFKTSVLLLTGGVGSERLAFVNALLPLLGLLLVALASLYALICVRGKAIPVGITGLVSIVFLTLNSNVFSIHRYLLSCLALYLIPVLVAQRYKRFSGLVFAAMYVGCFLQAILFTFFVHTWFAG